MEGTLEEALKGVGAFVDIGGYPEEAAGFDAGAGAGAPKVEPLDLDSSGLEAGAPKVKPLDLDSSGLEAGAPKVKPLDPIPPEEDELPPKEKPPDPILLDPAAPKPPVAGLDTSFS